MYVGKPVPRWAITFVIAAILLSVAGCSRSPVAPTPTIARSPTDTRPAATALQAPTPESTATITPAPAEEPAFSLIAQSGAPTVVGDALDLDLRLGDGDTRVYMRDDRLYIIGTIDPMALLDTRESARPQPVAHELQDARPVPACRGIWFTPLCPRPTAQSASSI